MNIEIKLVRIISVLFPEERRDLCNRDLYAS